MFPNLFYLENSDKHSFLVNFEMSLHTDFTNACKEVEKLHKTLNNSTIFYEIRIRYF